MHRLLSIFFLAGITTAHIFGANSPSNEQPKGLTIGDTVKFLERSLVQYVSFWEGLGEPKSKYGVLDTAHP